MKGHVPSISQKMFINTAIKDFCMAEDRPKSKIDKKLEKKPSKNTSIEGKVFCTGILHGDNGVIQYMQIGKGGQVFRVSDVKEFMQRGMSLWLGAVELELAGDSIRSKKNGEIIDNLDNAPKISF